MTKKEETAEEKQLSSELDENDKSTSEVTEKVSTPNQSQNFESESRNDLKENEISIDPVAKESISLVEANSLHHDIINEDIFTNKGSLSEISQGVSTHKGSNETISVQSVEQKYKQLQKIILESLYFIFKASTMKLLT